MANFRGASRLQWKAAQPRLNSLVTARSGSEEHGESHCGGAHMIVRDPTDDCAVTDDIVLSVIIATYNARDLLADCLRSIERNPPGERYEVIIVDDASKDDTFDMVRRCFPEVRLLRNEVNRHYAFSNNRAVACSRGKYLLLLNNDTIVLAEAIDRMLAFLREHPHVGAVGCKLLNEDRSVQHSVKSLPNVGSAFFGARSIITRLFPGNPISRQHLLHLGRDMTTPFPAGYVSSAAVMLPRHVMDKVGESIGASPTTSTRIIVSGSPMSAIPPITCRRRRSFISITKAAR